MRGQRVTGEQLNDRITAIHPQFGALPVRSVQPHPCPAGAIASKVGEGVVDALISQPATLRKVEVATGHRLGPGRQLAVRVGDDPVAGRKAQHGIVDQPAAR